LDQCLQVISNLDEHLWLLVPHHEVQGLGSHRSMQVLACCLPVQVLTSKDFTAQLDGDVEVKALVEYHVAQAAHKFVGNALHPFSALSIVQRRNR